MNKAVRTVLDDCLGVREGENVLVVTDPSRSAIGIALVEEARRMGAEAVIAEMTERAGNGVEPPPQVASAMLAADVVAAPTTMSLSHTEARHQASAKGVRVATLPGITEDMLVRTMNADYSGVRERSAAVAEALSQGAEVRITSPAGTDLMVGIEGREGLSDDGDLRAAGAFGNLPAGEGFIAPVEGKTSGTIVFDGSLGSLGILEEPLTIVIEDGYAEKFSGGAADEFVKSIEQYGRDAFAVAELGIGTNDTAMLTGQVLEDEKILGTVHVALGDNHNFGGSIRVSSHQDGVVLDATVTIDGKVVLQDGRLSI